MVVILLFMFSQKKKKEIAALIGIFIISITFIFSVNYIFNDVLSAHHRTRINVLLGKEIDPQGAGYNLIQSKIAIGSGGLLGKGFYTFLQNNEQSFDSTILPDKTFNYLAAKVINNSVKKRNNFITLNKGSKNGMEGDFDVLVSTTIIENAVDIQNANTIIINNAQNFGLSDLHQMRGRVGRSNKKAFCYFITSPYSSMTKEARKRIEAIEQHTELGSGFHIAMKDLEIRGAGDLLGAEQSGFINDIGFDTYHKILNEAVQELKTNEFKKIF